MTREDAAPPIVIVDPISSGGLYASAFAAEGIPAVAVISFPEIPAAYAGSFDPEEFTHVLTYDGDFEALVNTLRPLKPRGVLPGTEIAVELADALAAEVTPAVANDPERKSARRHKYHMAQALERARVPVLRQIASASEAEVAAWIERSGLTGRDLVVKPPKSGSTDGVTLVPHGAGWQEPFREQLGQLNQWQLVNDEMLVQEYARGTEYVVDTYSHAGRHTVADVCRYTKVSNGPHMAVYESMDWVDPADPVVPELAGYVGDVLDAVGFRYGAAHVEVMRTPEGPRLIEVNARPHGGGHPRFCREATGDSQVDRAARAFVRPESIPPSYELHRHVRVVFLLSRGEGVVRNAEILQAIPGLPSHHHSVLQVKNGDRLTATKDLLQTLAMGFVVLAHKDEECVRADHEQVRRLESELVLVP